MTEQWTRSSPAGNGSGVLADQPQWVAQPHGPLTPGTPAPHARRARAAHLPWSPGVDTDATGVDPSRETPPMQQPAESASLDLRGYLDVLRRRRWTVVATVAVAVALAVVATLLQSPSYRASAEILIETDARDQLFDPQTGQIVDPARDLQNEIEFIESDGVAEAVRAELEDAADIDVTAREDADIIVVSATNEDAALAARTANLYAETAIELRREAAIADYEQSAEVVETQLAEVSRRIVDTQNETLLRDARSVAAPWSRFLSTWQGGR